jgi:hypothetical protein
MWGKCYHSVQDQNTKCYDFGSYVNAKLYHIKEITQAEGGSGIATRYGLEGPGIESRFGARLSANVQTDHGAHPTSYTMGTESIPGEKRPGCGDDHPPSSTKVKGRVQLYICAPSGPSWPVLG